MFERLIDTVKIYRQGNGSKLFCLRDMGPKAAEMQASELEARIAQSKESCLHVQRMDYDWAQHRSSGPPSRQEAARTDIRVDRTVSQIYQIAKNYADGEVDSPQKDAGETVVSDVFPNGVFPITSLPYEEQYPAVRELCRRLEQELADEYEILGLTHVVQALTELNELFGSQLSVHDDQLRFDTVREVRQKADEDYAKVIICGLNATLDDLKARKHLFSAVEDQQNRIARHMRRRGNVPVMDPETGDIIDEGDLEPAGDMDPITDDFEPAPAPTPEPVPDF